jgi:hypothetical protein
MTIARDRRHARELINQGEGSFRLRFTLSGKAEQKLSPLVPTHGLVLEAGEVIVLSILIFTVGTVVAFAIFNGYNVRIMRQDGLWYLEFKK